MDKLIIKNAVTGEITASNVPEHISNIVSNKMKEMGDELIKNGIKPFEAELQIRYDNETFYCRIYEN